MLPLKLEGACTHNLKGVDLRLEPGQLVVVTGVSGSGKSSLALDTLYAEGQRRFVESFSPYARQFLERLARPPMKRLEPVPAAVAVDRGAPVKSSRSTVATMTDMQPLLAALFLREAMPVCPDHGCPAVRNDVSDAAHQLVQKRPGQRVVLSYPLQVRDTEHYLTVREQLLASGFGRIWVNGIKNLDQVRPSEAAQHGELEVVVDRLSLGTREQARLLEGLESAWRRGGGRARLRGLGPDQRQTFYGELTEGLSCPECARPLLAPTAGLFSYDSPVGACAECRGFGRVMALDLDKVIPDPYKTLKQKAIRPWSGESTAHERRQLRLLCERQGIPMDVPFKQLTQKQVQLILEGDGQWSPRKYGGVRGWYRWLSTKAYKMHVRVLMSRYRCYELCPACQGARLNERALGYTLGGNNIADWHRLEVGELVNQLEQLEPVTGQGRLVLEQLLDRLNYLKEVGLGYLTLDRQARSLSGGELQRVTLTAALGTSLHNALFVLDEPSVGLHTADVERLLGSIRRLVDCNNLVVVVEHDPQLIAAADRVVELGPGAGTLGGQICLDGSVEEARAAGGATARALNPRRASRASSSPSAPESGLSLKNVTAHNLKGVEAHFPLGCLCAVTGPSGSGKSSLAVTVLYRALARRLRQLDILRPGPFSELSGAEAIERVALVDQSPLGRTSRGNAATYTKAWDPIRKLFAAEPAARQAGLGPSHFSFNVDGGRCDACAGEGSETVEMQFLADVSLECPVCKGQRFKPAVLRVACRGFTVAGLLRASVDDAVKAFADVPSVLRALVPLQRLGLGYLSLGQPLSTLSGGEAQRLKLARALNDKLKKTLLIVDEPSAGLHADEVACVLDCFEMMVRAGGSVIVVEHDLDIIAAADWVIDMGPEAGARGGEICAVGTPSQIIVARTRTGEALARAQRLASGRRRAPSRRGPTASIRKLRFRGSAATKREGTPRSLELTINNAREHNLRNVTAQVPHGALTVVTGPSGSGKSSLVFDVMFAEAQRRFLETLTPYARQFLPTLPKPDVDSVVGVPPSIALEQRSSKAGARSTLATVTEIAHYLRLLYAKLGVPHCPEHDVAVGSTNSGDLFEQVRALKGKGIVLAPVVEARKGTYLEVFNSAFRDGVSYAECDGVRVATDDPPRLARTREHTIELVMADEAPFRSLSDDQLARAFSWGNGNVKIRDGRGQERRFSAQRACPQCGFSVPELDPRWFSFNTIQGRCPTCEGNGVLEAGVPAGRRKKRAKGKSSASGVSPPLPCPDCGGSRLHPVAAQVRLLDQRIDDFNRCSVSEFRRRLTKLRFGPAQKPIAAPIMKELMRRVDFLLDVGLGYLALDRMARTLSGGEMQRLRLAAQLGAGLTGALYVLDEPTVGLHPRDTQRLIGNLRGLVALGSTVVVVEHDADMIRAAEHLVDMGPGGGAEGGRVIAQGTPDEVLAHPESPTGRGFRSPPEVRRALSVPSDHPRLSIFGVRQHNLRSVDAHFPLARMNVVAGVSGSGKSTLVSDVLLPAVRRQLGLVADPPGAFDRLSSTEQLKRALSVDQSPIGKTPRSVPATFLGIWEKIRKLFAQTPEARQAGFAADRFSFNTASGGRCPECAGQGVITHEMSFLPDVTQECRVCRGLRFEPQTLAIPLFGLSVGAVLALTVAEAREVFRNHPKIVAPLTMLHELGAGYVKLGQGSHTLSGGEAQRLKLAVELTAGARHEPTLYVLDEPTTGLHQTDVERLIRVLSLLVERGDTLVIVEHHPWVIAGADHVVELGPEAGEQGGRIVMDGTPARLARRNTATGRVLRELVSRS